MKKGNLLKTELNKMFNEDRIEIAEREGNAYTILGSRTVASLKKSDYYKNMEIVESRYNETQHRPIVVLKERVKDPEGERIKEKIFKSIDNA